jgi:hypothetical protein
MEFEDLENELYSLENDNTLRESNHYELALIFWAILLIAKVLLYAVKLRFL